MSKNAPPSPREDPTELRRELHRLAEPSGRELKTADFIGRILQGLSPSHLLRGLGGEGLIAGFDGPESGPHTLLRCELDALPIPEPDGTPAWHSAQAEFSHKCGHDGHMAILLSVAQALAASPPACGRISLLFQPAEETGEGADRVLRDPAFSAYAADLPPDRVFALHNLPGYPLGSVCLRDGTFAMASCGMSAHITGRSAHAGEPERGISPAPALAALMQRLPGLPREEAMEDALLTLVHARLGSPAYGTAPGEAEIACTLRAASDETLGKLLAQAEGLIHSLCRQSELTVNVVRVEPFPATVNNPASVAAIGDAAVAVGLPVDWLASPMRWSEDFGHFTHAFSGALFGIGAGDGCPPLHDPRYDFPDALIAPATGLFLQLINSRHA